MYSITTPYSILVHIVSHTLISIVHVSNQFKNNVTSMMSHMLKTVARVYRRLAYRVPTSYTFTYLRLWIQLIWSQNHL